MDPLKRAASSTSSRRSGTNIAGNTEQFGRSDVSLQAERAAATLRGARPEGATTEARAAGLPHQRASADSQSSSSDLEFDFALPKHNQQPAPHAPSITSTIHPIATAGSDGTLDGAHAKSTDNLAHTATSRPTTGPGRLSKSRSMPRPGLSRPQHKSTPDLFTQGRSPGSPMTYQDLGTDYTRYYNPFSDSRRSSFSEHRDSFPRGGARTTGTTTPLAALHPANPFLTPNASTTKLNTLYDPEKNASVIDDRLIAPYEEKGMAAWPLIGDKEESDDEMHMPRDDDDIRYKPKLRDHFSRESIVSTIGLAFMVFGLLFIFIALPVMSFSGVIDYNSSYGVPASWLPNPYRAQAWATVNNKKYDYLKNIRTGLIDPDTPRSALEKKGVFGDDYELVFSDEFNENNRTFYEGDDPYFFAGDFWYGATKDLEWYDPDAVTTYDGTLELRLDKFVNHGLEFRSGMLNSWNHLCFKGGIFEVSVSLPGPAGAPGLWPGAWTMGNLGRPGYLSTTDGMWPYTYQACDVGITPNQSSSDGLSNLPGQRLPSCTCPGEDHPTPGTGRGAPEIDIIEVGATYPPHNMPIATQSFQVAPFDVHWYPNYNFTAFPDYSMSWYNGYTGGPYQQAISATTNLNKNWFDGKEYQRYNFEYVPGEGEKSYISWQIGEQQMFMLDGRSIGPNGNIKARQVSEEPMSMILNLGISNSWTWIDWDNMKFPAVMRVDYVRWYQKKGESMVTCDPPGFETTDYIKKHINAYTNPNFTQWDETGHAWPKHKLNSDNCKIKS
ncbi:beta-glucan synthesis-associated protein KRE6 [Paraphoma chrysanthemicola]|uniref:Beta-glucan synthesis-associated protein KRE6 n=1 Tax=Paraphoma chrysanthemicola TaxID=798071 RepID=A0A8K0VY43_9PLEO|nr:beta-glucan synthesis-associated protein KRE6 [Paraphoma chrysanthemicola]